MADQQYFLALVPPSLIDQRILSFKEEMREKFQVHHALKLPAHITLIPPFRISAIEEKKFVSELKEGIAKQPSFEVILSGFGAFKPRVIFVEVANPQPLIFLRKNLEEILKNISPEAMPAKERKFHPHITIATRDLDRKRFYDAWDLFNNRSFSTSFRARYIGLFKHDGKRWQSLVSSLLAGQ